MDMEEEVISRLKNVRHTLHAVQEEIKDNLTAEETGSALKSGFEVVEEYLDDVIRNICRNFFTILRKC